MVRHVMYSVSCGQIQWPNLDGLAYLRGNNDEIKSLQNPLTKALPRTPFAASHDGVRYS